MALIDILDYNMNEQEAFAYKLCMIWEDIVNKQLKNYDKKGLLIPKTGDPRKSILFKYCYKLARETKGLIKPEEYKFYIFSQIDNLKNFSDGKVHSLITPACLCGEKAWMRWTIWKNKFEKKLQEHSSLGEKETTSIKVSITDIEIELHRTKKYLNSILGDNYSLSKLHEYIKSKKIIRDYSFNKISSFYIVLSPIIKTYFEDIDEAFSFNSNLIRNSINKQILNFFEKTFSNEF